MKTKHSIKNTINAALILMALMPLFTKAQLNPQFPITNNLTCDVNVAFQVFDANCVNLGCGHPGVTIAAGQTWNAPICGNGHDIELTIMWTDVNGCTATMATGPVNTGLCNSGSTFDTFTTSCTNCNSGSITLSSTGALIQ